VLIGFGSADILSDLQSILECNCGNKICYNLDTSGRFPTGQNTPNIEMRFVSFPLLLYNSLSIEKQFFVAVVVFSFNSQIKNEKKWILSQFEIGLFYHYCTNEETIVAI